jgi:tetratricopeptide (TPR) repeat protein
VVLEGSIAQIGAEYSLILRAEACLNGESIASTKAQAQDKTHVLEALGRASFEMRKKLGESLATVEKFNTPLEQATTSSLEALRAYDFGYKTGDRGDFVAAIPWFQKAVSIDASFAMAYFVQFIQLQSLEAWIAMSRNEPAKAVATLQPTPYESRFVLSPNAYQRGLAYLANHQGKEAATEFQSILDHQGLVGNLPGGALAHLQMARAYDMQGDTAKARAAYQDFLTLWKDADPDIPILKQAKAEYAKLQ